MPEAGALAGIDFGTVRVGIAITDPGRILASPLETFQRLPQRELEARYFQKLVQDYQLVGFVVGLPVHSSGEESQKSSEARAFGAWLGEATQLPICFFDERYTTQHAHRLLGESGRSRKKRKESLDKIAAQILLQSYLDAGPHAADLGPASM